MIRKAYAKATKTNYQKLIKDNVVVIDNTRKVVYKGRRELVFQKSSKIKSNEPPALIKNLKENFLTWARFNLVR